MIMHILAAPIAGGAENLVRDICIELANKNKDVMIIFVSTAKDVGRCSEYEMSYLSSLDLAGVKYVFLGHKYRKKIFLGALKVKKFVKKYNVKFIHCHLYLGILLSGLVFKRVKVIYTHHSINLKLPSCFFRLLNYMVSAYVAICQACKLKLEAASHRKAYLIPNSVNPLYIKRKEVYKNKVHYSPLKIIMVGSFRYEKNYMQLLESVKLMKRKVVIDIYGEGTLKDEIASRINELNLQNQVFLKGNSNRLHEIYLDYDLFLMVSISEGLPISLIEATIAGLPVIATDVGGCREVVEYFGNGIIISEINSLNIAEAVDSFSEKALKMENTNFENVLSSPYSIFNSVNKHLELYEAIGD
jgi:glycosyltransferase involved in cell wall biosynthesis